MVEKNACIYIHATLWLVLIEVFTPFLGGPDGQRVNGCFDQGCCVTENKKLHHWQQQSRYSLLSMGGVLPMPRLEYIHQQQEPRIVRHQWTGYGCVWYWYYSREQVWRVSVCVVFLCYIERVSSRFERCITLISLFAWSFFLLWIPFAYIGPKSCITFHVDASFSSEHAVCEICWE